MAQTRPHDPRHAAARAVDGVVADVAVVNAMRGCRNRPPGALYDALYRMRRGFHRAIADMVTGGHNVSVESTIVRAHQAPQGLGGFLVRDEPAGHALGRTRGGWPRSCVWPAGRTAS